MHKLLTKLLKKRGIEDVTKLSSDEKADFDRFEKILSEGEITVDKIRKFCENQTSVIEKQWRDFGNDPRKNERLIVAHTIYKTLLEAIEAPRSERERLEHYLTSLLEGNT